MVISVHIQMRMRRSYFPLTCRIEAKKVGITSSASSAFAQVGSSVGTVLFNTISLTGAASYAASHMVTSNTSAAITYGFAEASIIGFGIMLIASIIICAMINVPLQK
jgi:hypothetical protein